jgi:hypothetical protein
MLAGLLVGCTQDGPAEEPDTASEPVPVEPVTVKGRVTRVSGELTPAARDRLGTVLTQPVAAYVQRAFVADRAGKSRDWAFASFTRAARRLAVRDAATLAGPVADADEFAVESARAYFSVLAPHGRAVGATARVHLEVLADDQPVRLDGRLLLTRTKAGWKIFGYDVARSDRQAGGS